MRRIILAIALSFGLSGVAVADPTKVPKPIEWPAPKPGPDCKDIHPKFPTGPYPGLCIG